MVYSDFWILLRYYHIDEHIHTKIPTFKKIPLVLTTQNLRVDDIPVHYFEFDKPTIFILCKITTDRKYHFIRNTLNTMFQKYYSYRTYYLI